MSRKMKMARTVGWLRAARSSSGAFPSKSSDCISFKSTTKKQHGRDLPKIMGEVGSPVRRVSRMIKRKPGGTNHWGKVYEFNLNFIGLLIISKFAVHSVIRRFKEWCSNALLRMRLERIVGSTLAKTVLSARIRSI